MLTIMKKILILHVIVICLTILWCSQPVLLNAEDESKRLEELQNQIKEYEAKIDESRSKQKTLASTIEVLNNQIYLTTIKIAKTKEEITTLQTQIEGLTKKIVQLDQTLNDVSEILKTRVEETYKRSFLPSVQLLFISKSFNEFFTQVKYLQLAQKHDKEMMFEMEEAKVNFDIQKELKESKQQELKKLEDYLSSQSTVLEQQKASKEELMRLTKNDEQNFQNLLAKAKAEFQAIQSILAGKGQETKVGDVNEGESIASIISGVSACSTGTHLHFEVAKGGAHVNPASVLSSKEVEWDLCGWYGCDSTFSFSGSWPWPVNGKPRVTQGYGSTAYSRSGAYGGGPHTGIDIVSDDLSVKAVQGGTLYRGSIGCGGGTLRYVKVHHKDTDTDSYYLHINYVK